jgi:MerR family transcriptional regulator, light-induced transcriptional regulator
MYTIKQAARLTGVPESSLRAWERRYGVVAPRRTESGYRVYDDDALAALSTMRRLVETGWAPAEAAKALREGTVPAPADGSPEPAGNPDATTDVDRFVAAAQRMDTGDLEECLDRGFALASFEQVLDAWLFPALHALGDAWVRGDLDVAGEHAASHAVHRRLAAAFEAAGSRSRGPSVVVGLPPGGRHELGALAFATACRRRGLDVLYLGADVPVSSWVAAVRSHGAAAAVMAVVSPEDRRAAVSVAERLSAQVPDLLVGSGGASGTDLSGGVRALPSTVGTAARELDDLLHARP